jgi:predicted metal-dependent hydrolase
MQLIDDIHFRYGIELFNREQFFECHEVLEELWRAAENDTRMFLQALIHLAVAFHHYRRDNITGARRQLDKSLRKLAFSLPEFAGVDTAALHRNAKGCAEEIGRGRRLQRFPRIVLN